MSQNAAILVIDDEEAIRDSCSQVLAKAGYRTQTAPDGNVGLEKMAETRPELVLVDLKMPGISGIDLLEKIAEIDPSIVCVVITGYATVESAVQAMKCHAYDFLPKPFTPDQLRIVVKRGLERRNLVIEAERLRREKQMLRENFVTLVSHQLRSPLASVRQYFGVIREGFVGDVTDKQKQIIERASKYIDNLMQLINDWLDMSRIDAGRIAEKLEPVALESVLAGILELAKPLADAGNVSLEFNTQNDALSVPGDPHGRRVHGSSLKVLGDRESLKQAFTNLVNNAIRYNRQGGNVTVSIKDQGHELAVEIADTGMGIAQENLPFIFDEFFRVKNSETQHITGSGLGLPIARKIIETHNGHIQIRSELGKGTTFTVLLPAARKAHRPEHAP